MQTQQISQRGSVKIRPLGATNYSFEPQMNNNNFNNSGKNIFVLPPVSQTSQNYNHKSTNEYKSKENKNLQPHKSSDGNLFDSNSQSNIQSNIVESPNLKKAVSKYSEVPENFDLNKDNSVLTKV